MAETLIQERYQFDFDPGGAVAELDRLAKRLETLRGSIDAAKASGKGFEKQQQELSQSEAKFLNILNQEVSTYDGINAKRKILSATLGQMTAGTAAYSARLKEVRVLQERELNTTTGLNNRRKELRAELDKLEKGTRDYISTLRDLEAVEKRVSSNAGAVAKSSGGFASALRGGLASIGVVVGIQEALRLGKESLDAASEKQQQKSALLNALDNQVAVQERLLAQADKLEANTLVDDDDIIKLDRYLASLGLTEKQIASLNDASVQLAAVQGTSVRSAADKLIAAQAGQVRGLAKLVPEVKSLTKAQLASGAAADLVAKKFAGSAEALATGLIGARNELKDFTDNLKEGFGDALTVGIGTLSSAIKNTFKGAFGETTNQALEFLKVFGQELLKAPGNLVAIINGSLQVVKALFNGTLNNFQSFSNTLQTGYLDLKEAIFGGLDTEDLLKSSRLAGERVKLALEDPFADGAGISDIFKKGFDDALKDADQFSKSFSGEVNKIDDTPFAPKTKAEIKAIAGSLADLEKQVNTLKEILQKSVVADDTAKLTPLLKQIDALEKRIQAAKRLQDEILNPTPNQTELQQAEAGLLTLEVKVDADKAKDDAKKELDKLANDLAGSVGVEAPVEVDTEQAKKDFEIQKYFLDQENKIRDEAVEKQKDRVAKLQEGAIELAQNIIGAIQSVFDAQQNRADKAVDFQKSKLDEALANSEEFTAAQIKLERDRLDKLQKQQEQAAQKAKAAQIAQVIANTVIAVAKAAGQTGVAAPIAIITTLAAIAAGIGSAVALSQNAFDEGTDYVPLGNNRPGKDTVHARLTAGEAVLDKEDNRNYHPTVKAMRRHQIPAEVLNGFVESYRGGSQWMPKARRSHLPEYAETAAAGGGTQSSTNYYFQAKLGRLEQESERQTAVLYSIAENTRPRRQRTRLSTPANRPDRFV